MRDEFKSRPLSPAKSWHEGPFSQDFNTDDGRLIHAEWDGGWWVLKDADTGELEGVWSERQLPAPGTAPAPYVGWSE